MNMVGDCRGFLIGHCEELVELTEMILHVANPHILIIRSSRYINKINLNTLKQTFNYNRFQRPFELAIDLSIADLIQLDQKIDLLGSDPIILSTNVNPSSILFYMAQTIVNSCNGVKDPILADYLSFGNSHLPGTSKQLTFLIDEVGLNPGSFLAKCPIKPLRDELSKLSNSSFLFRDRYTFPRLILTSIQYKIKDVTYYFIK